MTKVATVQAQQKWEYRSTTKHTETTLLNELNELGKLGWELVAASYNKDLKGIWAWTAILKRPLVGQAVASPPPGEAVAETSTTETSKTPPSPQGFDLSGDVFDLKAP